MIDEQTDEALSALVDGELPLARAERLLDRILADEALRDRWHQHHLARAAMTPAQSMALPGNELAARVSAALDEQPALPAVPVRAVGRRKWRIALTLAASVAIASLIVVFGLSAQRGNVEHATPVAAVDGADPVAAVASSGAPGSAAVRDAPLAVAARGEVESSSALTRMTWNDARPAVEARLNGYLLDHNEYLADGVRGMLPYARVVGYDARN